GAPQVLLAGAPVLAVRPVRPEELVVRREPHGPGDLARIADVAAERADALRHARLERQRVVDLVALARARARERDRLARAVERVVEREVELAARALGHRDGARVVTAGLALAVEAPD